MPRHDLMMPQGVEHCMPMAVMPVMIPLMPQGDGALLLLRKESCVCSGSSLALVCLVSSVMLSKVCSRPSVTKRPHRAIRQYSHHTDTTPCSFIMIAKATCRGRYRRAYRVGSRSLNSRMTRGLTAACPAACRGVKVGTCNLPV